MAEGGRVGNKARHVEDGGISNTVEVQGFSRNTSQEVLEMYFENSRRSGGGDVEEVQIVESVAYITFKEAEVAQRVVSHNHHQVDGQTLTVTLLHPSPPKLCYANRVLLQGLNSAVTEELLRNFLETKTKAEVREFLYGEEEGKVVVTLSDNIDIVQLGKTFQERRIEGAILKVARVSISNCIIVQNLQPFTSHDAILFYFENKRRSGGGSVERVEMKAEKGYCLVYFDDHSVIDKVLSQSHKVDGADVEVHIHHECLGRRSSRKRFDPNLRMSSLGHKDGATLEEENTDDQAKDKASSSVSSNPDKESDFVEVQEWQENDGKNCTLPLWIKYKTAPEMRIIKDIKKIPCSWNFRVYWNFYTKTKQGQQMLHEIVNRYNCSVTVCTDDEDLFIFEVTEKSFEQKSDVVHYIHVVLENVYKCAHQFLYFDTLLVDQRVQGDVLQLVRQRKELDGARIELMGQQDHDAMYIICTEKDKMSVIHVITEIIHNVMECFENQEEIVSVDHMWQKVMNQFGYIQKLGDKYPKVTIILDKTKPAIMLKGPRDQSKAAADHLMELEGTARSEVKEDIFSPGCQFEIFTYPKMCDYIDNIIKELSIVWIPNHLTKKIHFFSKKLEKIKCIDKLIKGCVQERLYPLPRDQLVCSPEMLSSIEELKKKHSGKIVINPSPTGLLVTSADEIFESVDAAVQEIISKQTDLKISRVHEESETGRIRTTAIEKCQFPPASKEDKDSTDTKTLDERKKHDLKTEGSPVNPETPSPSGGARPKRKSAPRTPDQKNPSTKETAQPGSSEAGRLFAIGNEFTEAECLTYSEVKISSEVMGKIKQRKLEHVQKQFKVKIDFETFSIHGHLQDLQRFESCLQGLISGYLDDKSLLDADEIKEEEEEESEKVYLDFKTEVAKEVLDLISHTAGEKGVHALVTDLRKKADVDASNGKVIIYCHDFQDADCVQTCVRNHYKEAKFEAKSSQDAIKKHLIDGGNADTKELLQFAYSHRDWDKILNVEGGNMYLLGTLQLKEEVEAAVQAVNKWCHDDLFLTSDEQQKAAEAVSLVKNEFSAVFIKQAGDRITLKGDNADSFEKAKQRAKVALGRIRISSRRRRGRSLQADGESFLSLLQDDMMEESPASLPSDLQTSQHRAVITSKIYNTREGIKVKVYIGDIVSLPVDCIVNAANQNLSHVGGVALAIAKAAGSKFDQEGEEYVRRYGPVPVTQCCVTSAGRLDYKKVIRVVGPQWSDYKHNEKSLCARDLKKTIVNCLMKANTWNMTSIAVPSISSGIFGVPTNICAQMYVQGVVEFSRTCSLQSKSVQEIHFVDMQPEICHLTQLAFDAELNDRSKNELVVDNIQSQMKDLSSRGQEDSIVKTQNEASATIKPLNYAEAVAKGQGSMQNPYVIKPWEHTSILIYNHDITDIAVDAIVCPVFPNVEGGIVKLVKRACGSEYANVHYKHVMGSIKDIGDTYVRKTPTSRPNLPFHHIIHIYSPRWIGLEEHKHGKNFKKLIEKSVKKIFDEAMTHGIASVALPVLGIGDKTTPVKILCEYMMDGIAMVRADPHMVSQMTIHLVTNERSLAYQLKEIACQQSGQKFEVSGETLQNANRHVILSKHAQKSLKVRVLSDCKRGHESQKETCPICLDTPVDPRAFKECGHVLCRECMELTVKNKPLCPVCGKIYGIITGNQPQGNMTVKTTSISLPGFKNCGTINILYRFPDGIQTEGHPNPGKPYRGTSRHAYLPDNTHGRKVLSLLRKAFDRRLVFTVGRSVTTEVEDTVTWNHICHKTNKDGGPQNFGYPDPDYLRRVQEDLAANGVTEDT